MCEDILVHACECEQCQHNPIDRWVYDIGVLVSVHVFANYYNFSHQVPVTECRSVYLTSLRTNARSVAAVLFIAAIALVPTL